VLVVTVYPQPDWPYNLTPYLFLIMLAAGFAYMQWRESRAPGALRRGAAVLIQGSGNEDQRSERVGDDLAIG
jgi:hypothetical protein